MDGRELWISTTGAPMRAADGQIAGTVLVTRDVTARHELERQAAEHASQLEAISTLWPTRSVVVVRAVAPREPF